MFKPQLASKIDADFKHVEWGNICASPKLDGIRAVVISGKVYSRSMLLLPNRHLQQLLSSEDLEGLDGEVVVGDPCDKDVYNRTESAVMSRDGVHDFTFWVFDQIAVLDVDYAERLAYLSSVRHPQVKVLEQLVVHTKSELLTYEAELLALGYEGVMVRKLRGPNSYYKQGRATPKQGNLLKLKRFTDTEAEIVGFEEEMANLNEAYTSEVGTTKRSSHQENKVGKGTLGSLVCRWTNGLTFNIGTGFTAAQRKALWEQRETLPGRLAKFKYFEVGTVDRPRFPVFLGFRSSIDV